MLQRKLVLTQIPTFASHFENSSGCRFQNFFVNLGHILSLCRHFLASAQDNEATNDEEARKQ